MVVWWFYSGVTLSSLFIVQSDVRSVNGVALFYCSLGSESRLEFVTTCKFCFYSLELNIPS